MEIVGTKSFEMSKAITERDKMAIAVLKGLSMGIEKRHHLVVNTNVGI